MKNIPFEKLLRKTIPEVNSILNCVFENNILNHNFFEASFSEDKYLYNNSL